jgi:hypothetical protein
MELPVTTVEPNALTFIYAAAFHVAGVLAVVYAIALLCSRTLPRSRR